MADEEIVPRKKKDDGPSSTRSIYVADSLWEEVKHSAKREGYAISEMVTFLLRAGLRAYQKQRALEAGKSASDEKP